MSRQSINFGGRDDSGDFRVIYFAKLLRFLEKCRILSFEILIFLRLVEAPGKPARTLHDIALWKYIWKLTPMLRQLIEKKKNNNKNRSLFFFIEMPARNQDFALTTLVVATQLRAWLRTRTIDRVRIFVRWRSFGGWGGGRDRQDVGVRKLFSWDTILYFKLLLFLTLRNFKLI